MLCYVLCDIFGELHSVHLFLPALLKVMVPLMLILKGEVSFAWHISLEEGKTNNIN